MPTEQTKLSIEMMGPTRGPQTSLRVGLSDRKNACQTLSGTQAASAPAMRKPSARSVQMLYTSM